MRSRMLLGFLLLLLVPQPASAAASQNPGFDRTFRRSPDTTASELVEFMNAFKHAYRVRLEAVESLNGAKKVCHEFFVEGVKAGFDISELIDMMFLNDRAIATYPTLLKISVPDLIEYVKAIDGQSIYREAGVPFERDHEIDQETGKPKRRGA